jgi:formylglycine-generating enzyme required for sulfatase activity
MSQLSKVLIQWTMASGAALVGLFALGGQAYSDELHGAGTSFTDCTGCPEMVVVPAGNFTMGSPKTENNRNDNEGPQHEVTFDRAFAVGKFEVTFAEWDKCLTGGGCKNYRPDDKGWGRGARPVVNVLWSDAQSYVAWLSQKTGAEYRLLSESEWEYAARAGTETEFSTGKTITADQANFNGDYTYNGSDKGENRGKTVEVGSFAANKFGLHDMHGNVLEWVEDCYKDSYLGAPDDGSAHQDNTDCYRVYRGGSWGSDPQFLRSASRYSKSPFNRNYFLGFRLARVLR